MGARQRRSRTTKAATEQGRHGRRGPPQAVTLGHGEDQRRHGREEQGESRPVEVDPDLELAAPGDEQQGRQHAHQPDGDVHEEEQPPAAGGEQEPTDGRAEGQTEGLCRPLRTEGPTEPAARDGQRDDGHAVGLQHGRTEGLEGPEAVQHHQAGGGGTQHRAGHEDGEAVEVEELAADHVGEPSDRRHRGHQDQQIAQADPADGTDAGVEGPLEGGKGQGDDAGIQLAHEGPDADGRHGQQIALVQIPDGPRTTRFDHESLPRSGPGLVVGDQGGHGPASTVEANHPQVE
jgi:hypothetical protein